MSKLLVEPVIITLLMVCVTCCAAAPVVEGGPDQAGGIDLQGTPANALEFLSETSAPVRSGEKGVMTNAFPSLYVNFSPGPEYGDAARKRQGEPSIERAPGGRLWAAWFNSPVHEDRYAYLTAVTSVDDGRTWSDVRFVIDPDCDGGLSAYPPVLWLDPQTRLWLFWWMHGYRVNLIMAMHTDDPDSETKERRARATRMTRPPACRLRSPGGRTAYETKSAMAGEGGRGWPQGNGTWREGSLQAVSPLAGARSRRDGCRGGQSVSRQPPDGVGNSPRPNTGTATAARWCRRSTGPTSTSRPA